MTVRVLVCLAVACCSIESRAAEPLPKTVRFNRDIRPILSDACYKCHGPDSTTRKADLRLDTKAALFNKRGDVTLIVPKQPAKSELFRRISTSDADVHMPPKDSGRVITKRQTAMIRKWIEQGGGWEPHWAFIPPSRPAVPKVRSRKRLKNAIDAFVVARLERLGRNLSAEASKETLIRRVTLDLTGLPPTLQEIDDFLNDKSANAYEKVVDRLLKSPRFGEKMAVDWLDAARFADTSGYQNDGPRSMWRYRDWVIEAFNSNKPYDKFVVEQLAGDMIADKAISRLTPDARMKLRIATAFNRNHRGNAEGGVVPEEFQVEYVVDRVETTYTIFQGLTMGCARCHDHKFDPLSQKDFYRSFAYFNNIPEYGRAIKEGNSPPFIKAPTNEQRAKLAGLDRQLDAAKRRFAKLKPKIAASRRGFEKTLMAYGGVASSVEDGLIAHYPLNRNSNNIVTKKASIGRKPADRADTTSRIPYRKGRINHAALLDGKRFINAGNIANFGYFDKFSLGAWIKPATTKAGTVLSRMTDVEHGDGYALALHNGKLQFNLVKRWLDDSIRVETKTSIPGDKWTHVFATYDGSRVAKGIRIYINGKSVPLNVKHDFLNQTMQNAKEPLRIGAGGGPKNRFRGLIDDVRVYGRALDPTEVLIVSTPRTITQIYPIPVLKRTMGERHKMNLWYLKTGHHKEGSKAWKQLRLLCRKRDAYYESIPTIMVMREMKTPRKTHVLKRGEYDKPGERVFPGVPASLAATMKSQPKNRLELARWMVSRDNPLTARVAVNRFWQMLFGTGLVKTAEDFGSQGERPSHPQLLDWLAVEFRTKPPPLTKGGPGGVAWDVKRLLKTIVMSGTYRQSSKASGGRKPAGSYPEADATGSPFSRDPANRLLARGPRYRMSAEMIRDQALFLAGLLTEKRGGPSVLPYQPKGLWKEIATDGDYNQSHGPNLYRRSMYTYWKRTVSPPVMSAFDAPAREFCRVRRPRTNTPLQALALLNEVSFVEAARAFAQRAMKEGGKTPEMRITYAFRLATSRKPKPVELKILLNGYRAHLKKYQSDRNAAIALISTGEAPRDKTLKPAEHAAMTAIASVILNLDEVMTKD